MKKIIALVLALALCLTAVSVMAEETAKVKVGFIFLHDEQSTYDLNFMNAAKEAFAVYLNDVNLDSRQIYFVNQIVEYIVHNGLMKDLSVLQDAPFTDNGSIVEVFTDVTLWFGIKKIIDRINANAIAA